ncbi:hypothetical protein SDC9_155380 [bioreactor metagenome]|uniref:DUF2007 domain-containing protein n=1 Tax=bioreactor metagenome TaxID=1076179 RepID=A0A645F3J0_9ZZZZ
MDTVAFVFYSATVAQGAKKRLEKIGIQGEIMKTRKGLITPSCVYNLVLNSKDLYKAKTELDSYMYDYDILA